MLKEFKAAPRSDWEREMQLDILYGQVTPETDPMKKGWQVKKIGKVYIVGRRDVKGCFSVMVMERKDKPLFDIAYYEDLTGFEVFTRIKEGKKSLADEFRQIAMKNCGGGWFRPMIHMSENGLSFGDLNKNMFEEL